MRTQNKDNFCVILAGGKGRRLWPCSREEKPKQFLDFFSTGRTLLQHTFDRMSKIIAVENIYVNTNHVYAHFVEEQLPELPRENILSEPIFRNTAPSVAWATYRIYHQNKNARMVVVPSDQAVFKEDAFLDNIEQGLNIVVVALAHALIYAVPHAEVCPSEIAFHHEYIFALLQYRHVNRNVGVCWEIVLNVCGFFFKIPYMTFLVNLA